MATRYARTEGPGSIYYDDGGASQRLQTQIEQDGQSVSRHDCREKICEMQRREARKTELKKSITKLNGELEKAVADHHDATNPIQSAIREIDKAEITATLAGKSLAKAQEGRRRDLRSQIDELNSTLEEIASRCREKLALLEEELQSGELDTTALGKLKNDLIQVWGDPDKIKRLRALHDCQELLKPTINQLTTLCDELKISIEIGRAQRESTEEASRQLDRANLRLSILQRATGQLFQEANRLLQEIRDE